MISTQMNTLIFAKLIRKDLNFGFWTMLQKRSAAALWYIPSTVGPKWRKNEFGENFKKKHRHPRVQGGSHLAQKIRFLEKNMCSENWFDAIPKENFKQKNSSKTSKV